MRLQSLILSAVPNAISSLVALLNPDANQILQADSMILLCKLAKGNLDLAKSIAFQSAFESLFKTISETDLDGDDINCKSAVELVLALLMGNPSNQLMFFEGGYISKIDHLLDSVESEKENANVSVRLIMQALDALLDQWLSKIVPSIQDEILDSPAIMKTVLEYAFDQPASKEAFALLADLLLYNPKGQHQLLRQRHDKSLVVTLFAMKSIDGSEDAARVFRALVAGDDAIKLEIASTFTPPPEDEDGEDDGTLATAGSSIVNAFVHGSSDAKVAASSLLMGLLQDCKDTKQIAMNFQVATEDANSEDEAFSMSLLHTLIFDFVGTPKDQPILLVSFMMLFCVWFHGFPEATRVVLAEGPVVSFLLELVEDHHPEAIDQIICQGVASVLYGVCLLESGNQAEYKAIIRTRIGREIYRGKWKRLLSVLHETDLDPIFVDFMERHHAKMLEEVLLPPGASASPELDALKQGYEASISAYSTRVAELEASLQQYQAASVEWSHLQTRLHQSESELASTKAELDFARLSLSADGDGQGVAQMVAENERLRRLADSFVAQMLAVEAENEELLRQLAQYDSGVEPVVEAERSQDGPKVTSLVEAAISKLQPKLQPPPSHQSNTFDV